MKYLKISEFAKMIHSTSKTLRLYEDKGLLNPTHKDSKGYRYYSSHQKKSFDQIKKLQSLGFSLLEIRAILPFIPKDQIFLSLLTRQKQKLLKQIEELDKKIKMIDLLSNNTIKYSNNQGREVYMKTLSEHIKNLSHDEIKQFTKELSSDDYLLTVSMVDGEAKINLFSILSNEAKNLVENDLLNLKDQLMLKWSKCN